MRPARASSSSSLSAACPGQVQGSASPPIVREDPLGRQADLLTSSSALPGSGGSSVTYRPPSPGGAVHLSAGGLLELLVPEARWRLLLDLEVPLAPQAKERARSSRSKTPDPAPTLGPLGARGRGGLAELLSAAPRPAQGHDGHFYTPANTRRWTAQAAQVIGAHWRAKGLGPLPRHLPVRVESVFWFARPANPLHEIFHVVRPDRDNLDKIVLDTLIKAGVLADDAQVCAGQPLKLYCAPGARPRVRVVIASLEMGGFNPAEETACRS